MKIKNASLFLLRYLVLSVLFVIVLAFPIKTLGLSILDEFRFYSCLNEENVTKKLNCERSIIKQSVEQGNTSLAVHLFKQAIVKSYDVDCHTVGHEIGHDVYVSLKKRGFVRIGDPMSDCAYGFWHGFMSGFTQDEQNGEKLKVNLSQVCARITGGRKGIYSMCYHGFGLGFVGDPPRTSNWGNVEETIKSSSQHCFELTNISEYNEQCLSGVFHQTLQYMQNNEYKYSLPKGNSLYSFCDKFTKEYQKPCLEQLLPLLSSVVGHDIKVLYKILDTKINLDHDFRSQAIISLVAGSITGGNDDDAKNTIDFCSSLETLSSENCFKGIIDGLNTKTNGGKEDVIKKVNFLCGNNINCLRVLKDKII